MRRIFAAAIALIVLGSAQVQAATKWVCHGPYVACVESRYYPTSKKKYAKKKSYTSKKKYKKYSKKKKSYKKYAKSYKAKKKYSSKSKKYKKKYKKAYGGSVYQSGVASYYWQPQKVASGGWFNPNAMTAAHKTLPFGTKVRVTHMGNGRSVVVRINDRGPYIKGRVIDLSKAAAKKIKMTGQGVARVKIAVLGK